MATRVGNYARDGLVMDYVKYDRQELIDNVYLTITNLRGRYLNDPEIDFVDIRLQLVDGTYHIHTGDSQFDTDRRGSWGYGSFDTRFSDEDFVDGEIFRKTAEGIVDEALADYQLEHYSESKRNGI